MKKELLANKKGASVAEAIIAAGIFFLVVTSIVGGIFFVHRTLVYSGEKARATFLAEEGLEAIRNMRDNDFGNVNNGTYGLAVSGGKWLLSGTSDINGIFTRSVVVSSGSDVNSKRIESTVTWNQGYQENKSVTVGSVLTNWRISKSEEGGVLVYGDGGTTSDAVKWRRYKSDGTWDTAASLADVDTSTTNRALRAVKIYASSTRNEYVTISRHYDGTKQYVYAQVWNGSSWGSVQLLSSWTANTFLDVQNFDGTYLQNGDFMAVFGDFTNTPKFRIWNGSSWGLQTAMKSNHAYPVYVTAKARPGTNEVMAVFAGQGKRTETEYYNGNGYSTSNWTFTQHATNTISNVFRFADFNWSSNSSTVGLLVYADNARRYITAKIFTANGNGGGAWSSSKNSAAQPNSSMSVGVKGRKGANEFMTFYKDNKNPQGLRCEEISNFTPTFLSPTNNVLTTSSVNGNQLGMDFDYLPNGLSGLALYTDNTAIPKFRTYDPSGNVFSSAFSLPALGSVLYTNRIFFDPNGSDALILLGDANRRVYSVMFDGSEAVAYTTPTGKALTTQGTNGSANSEPWYDFTWRKY